MCMINETVNLKRIATVFWFPNKIVIATKNLIDKYTFYTTTNFTELPIDISNNELGERILYHLNKSIESKISNAEIREEWKNFKREIGFKTEKDLVRKSRCVNIIIENNKMYFEPKKTMISKRAFYGMPDAISEFPILNSEQVGRETKESLEKCLSIE